MVIFIKFILIPETSASTTSTSDDNSDGFVVPDFSRLNKTLQSINVSPVTSKKMRSTSYKGIKLTEITSALKHKVFNVQSEDETNEEAESEILKQLKEKFAEPSITMQEKFLILTTLPKSWSARRIQHEFNVPFHTALKSKKLQEEGGILSTPDLKPPSNILENETIDLVHSFYEDDDISRICPGKRDYVITTENGSKVTKQRRMMLCNLSEAYYIFKQNNPNRKIGFSKFSILRPPNCVLGNSCGTHTVCVCIYHQNVKLMFDVIKKTRLVPENFKTYHDVMTSIICSTATDDCILQKCEKCPGTDDVLEMLRTRIDADIEEVTIKQWQQVDRCSIETIKMPVDDFIETFCNKLTDLVPHHHIAQQQGKYLKACKEDLKKNEIIMICDFSENYSFVVQDAVQGFHWANAQCTIHPTAMYYRDDRNEIQFTSLVAIAESLKHNHTSVRLFIKDSIQFVKRKLPSTTKIIFFSDGAGGQYKNRMTFYNICKMKAEFNIDAEWNFFATCHGKGPCDALGGVLKRNAAKASLQNKSITNAKQLYEWAITQDSRVNYSYFTNDDFLDLQEKDRKRYDNVKTIPGTQKYHFFTPENEISIRVKNYSLCNTAKIIKLVK